jgi:hypothetical protein
MVYKFVKACHADFPKLDYGYLFEVSSFEELLDYYIIKAMPDMQRSMYGLSKAWETNRHTADAIAQLVERMAKNSGIAPVDCAADLLDDMMKGQLEMLSNGPVYFQKNGSYMPGGKGIKISDRIEKDSFVWPTKKLLTESDIKLTKWFGGVHHYVTVDGIQLGKGNTVEHAKEIGMEYIKKHNEK